VIAAAIRKFVHFEISPSPDGELHFVNSDTGSSFSRSFDENTYDEFFKFLSQICWRLKDKIKPLTCRTWGDLPIGSGLSSSAACSVGFIRGLNEYFNLALTNLEVAELAFQVEHNDLGIMCGRMDQYSVACGGVTFLETGAETKVTTIPMTEVPFVIGDSCEPRQAKVILNKTMSLLEAKDPLFVECFEGIHQNVMNGYEAIKQGNFRELGRLMNVHQTLERRMGASTKRIDAMIDAALAAGAWGAKQIGAGGGGCMIALCPENADAVMKAVEDCGGRAWHAGLFTYD
jgi:mevalonate kinase